MKRQLVKFVGASLCVCFFASVGCSWWGVTSESPTAPSTSQYVTLNVTVTGAGSGTVTSSPGGSSCSSDCVGSYATWTVVTLTAAVSNGGSTFAGWSGDCSGNAQTASVTMDAARSCTATFDDPSLRAVFDVSVTPGEDNLELNEAGVWLDGSEVFRTACSSPSGCTDQSTALRLSNENAPTSIASGEHTLGVKITDFDATGATACVICLYEFFYVRVTIWDSSGTTVQTINLPNREGALDPGESTDWPFTVN